MAETVIPTIMDIARNSGYEGDAKPETVIEALLLLGDVIAGISGGSAITYKGSVATYADLPSDDVEVGDMYIVQQADATHGVAAGDFVVWNGASWDVEGSSIDISDMFVTLSDSDIDALFA